jgi:hypothetical protein
VSITKTLTHHSVTKGKRVITMIPAQFKESHYLLQHLFQPTTWALVFKVIKN